MKRWTPFGVLGAIAIALLLCGAASAGAAISAAGHMRYAIASHADFSNLSLTAQRHDYVIVHAWHQDELAEIKAADPTTKVLVYKNMTSSRVATNPDGYASSGVPHQEADGHEEWFLHDKTSGERFTFKNYPSAWAMNVGSPSYQERWADNVVSELESEGWDGVFMDNVDTTMKWNYEVSQIAEHDTDAKWQAATESALSYIAGRVRAAGKLAISNIGSFGGNAKVGRSWLRYVDGAMDENFVKWGTAPIEGYAWEGHWNRQLDSLKYAQQHGKIFLARTGSSNDDGDAARYGWASLLLGAAGKAHFALHGDYTNETWFPEYEYEIGEPVGPESRDPNGIRRRPFTNGIVVVNPTTSQRSADLCGTYSGSGYNRVNSVTLGPSSAAILTRDGDGSGGSCESGNPGDHTGGGTGGADTGTEGDKHAEDVPTVKLGRKKVKKGRIVAKGLMKPGGREAVAASFAGTRSANGFRGIKLRFTARRRGADKKTRAVRVRRDGRFVGRVRVCQPGRYKLVAVTLGSEGRYRWPGSLRVRRKQLPRCPRAPGLRRLALDR